MTNFHHGLKVGWPSVFLAGLAGVFLLPPITSQAIGEIAQIQSHSEVKTASKSVGSQLMIDIEGLKVPKGQTCFTIFESERGFPTEGDVALRNECVAITQSSQTLRLQGLKPGKYAIAVLHDLNGDRQANRNFLGLPVEGFGFSRNPQIGMRAPRFEEVAIPVKGKQTRIQIRLNYLL